VEKRSSFGLHKIFMYYLYKNAILMHFEND